MNTLKNTWLLGAAACLLSVNSLAAQQDTTYNFRVLLDNKPIGMHQFDVIQKEGAQTVESKARFDVKVLFITAFKYRHSSSETWSDNCLTAIDATTNSNGKQQEVVGERVNDVLEVDSSVGETSLDGCVQTFAYWNPSILEASQLLNSQTGDYVDVNVTALGSDEISLGQTKVPAVKYKIQSAPEYEGKPVDITLWYDSSQTTWLALESLAKGNRTLRYELDASELPKRSLSSVLPVSSAPNSSF